MKQWQYRFPPFKETVVVGAFIVLFLLLTGLCIGLRPEHFLMIGLFGVLFFASSVTRKLAVALLPFVLFGISYDWMRIYPNYEVNPIDVQGLYETEKALFGFISGSQVVIPCEYFAQHHHAVADVFAGFFYLCWVPVPIAFGLWLYLKGMRGLYLHFACVFLLVNLLGFVGYYIFAKFIDSCKENPFKNKRYLNREIATNGTCVCKKPTGRFINASAVCKKTTCR